MTDRPSDDRLSSTRSDAVGRVLLRWSSALAVFGGFVLAALTLMSVYSIVARQLTALPGLGWVGQMAGAFELVELGSAVAIFAFLPYCQMVRGNIAVDFFTAGADPRVKAALAALGNLLFTAIAAVLTWRLMLGAADMRQYRETTMVLRVPVWWAYVPAALAMILLTVVCAYTVVRSVREAAGAGEPSTGARRE